MPKCPSKEELVSIGSDNSISLSKWQAVIWGVNIGLEWITTDGINFSSLVWNKSFVYATSQICVNQFINIYNTWICVLWQHYEHNFYTANEYILFQI